MEKRALDIYSLAELGREELDALLDRSERLRETRASTLLAGRSIVLLFLSPSLRTRVSMELAGKQLGAHVVTLQSGAGLWQLESGEGVVMRGAAAEHMKEAAGVLSRYGDLLAVRAFPKRRSWEEDARDEVLLGLRRWSDRPILNLESSLYHPCQGLADLLTLRRTLGPAKPGTKVVLSWADHPKALPVAVPNSFALAATRAGWDLCIARPDGYDLPDSVMQRCRAHAEAAGSALEVTSDREAAYAGARVIYAKSWGRLDRYGDDARELRERAEVGLSRWRVDEGSMALTDDAYFMHCLPVRRNVVVTDGVIDSPRSLVFEQAENRLHVQKAMLSRMLEAGDDA